MSQNLKLIPQFKNEDEERDFWATADTSEYFDFSKAKRVIFPNLKPTTKSISIRLPEWIIYELKSLANKRDIPYQALIKTFLSDKLEEQHKVNI